MATYNISRTDDILTVGFGQPADNDQIVEDAVKRLKEMYADGELDGGGLIKVNGPASLPVAMVLAHKLSHLFGAVACFDPKKNQYVVAISHDPKIKVGAWID